MKRRIKYAAEIRLVFPPSTELVSLYYLGGDGQEALPAGTLPQPLRAGVSNERWPVEGAQVRFLILDAPIDPDTLQNTLTVAVTVDMPFPLNRIDRDMFGPELIGYEPLTLDGKLELHGNKDLIRWEMSDPVQGFLFGLLSIVAEFGLEQFVVVHLTLKGNFIETWFRLVEG